MKERPILFSGPMVRAIFDGRKTQTRRVVRPQEIQPQTLGHGDFLFVDEFGEETIKPSPFGQPGGRLWVRETWCQPFAETKCHNGCIYCADGPEYLGLAERRHNWGAEATWKRSIHMPRKYCRLILDVKVVRVERLQEISDHDILWEGINDKIRQPDRRVEFHHLWDSLNKKRGFGWDTNPWVWVIEFKKVASEQ